MVVIKKIPKFNTILSMDLEKVGLKLKVEDGA